ncbi:DUF397 domain-containing protein [Streptomyces sp. NPDC005474]|uniref:DUF397 domain-containing protein n=1 Tax=Streptomyces sp. NPDC005474 TaxID=3154878 RepID=UPI0034565A68
MRSAFLGAGRGREGAALARGRGVVWRKSSYSGGSGSGDSGCCEVAVLPGAVCVRDSKQPDAALVTFTGGAWCAAIPLFLASDAAGRGHE